MNTLVLCSPSGGSGSSSLAVLLGLLLRQLGQRSLLLELDPANRLSLLLGVEERADTGLLTLAQSQRGFDSGWPLALYESPQGQAYLPFGQSDTETLRHFEHLLHQQPDWLALQLQAIAQDPAWADACLLIDAGRLPSVYAMQALPAADACWVVLRPDAPSLLALPDVAALCQHLAPRWQLLFNQLDPSFALHQDLLALAKSRWGDRLLARWVHRDQAIPDCVAAGVPLPDYAPHAQALDDLQALATQLFLEGAG